MGNDVNGYFGAAFGGSNGLGFVDFSIGVDGNGNAIELTSSFVTTSTICFTPDDDLASASDFCSQLVWSQPSYNGNPNYLFSYLQATEVEDGGGATSVDLDEIRIHFGWTEPDMSLGQGCVDHDCLLPVELSEFNAVLKDRNNVSLNWITKSEINSSHFEVERRADFETEFKSVAIQSGSWK